MIPLTLKLRKRRHKELALAQDLIVEELYRHFNEAVLHGGTAIWRCYKGNRFSEDIDVYIPRNIKKINALFEALEKKGFDIKKKKVGENSLYSAMIFNRVSVRLEALFKTAGGSLVDFETSDGNLITVYCLTPEELIAEKVTAYLKRLKVRDLYDIFFLLRHVQDRSNISIQIGRLAKGYKPPVDEPDLRALIITGLVPTPEKMLEYIRRWESTSRK